MSFSLFLLMLVCGSGPYFYYRHQKKVKQYKEQCEAFLKALDDIVLRDEIKNLINCWFDESKYVSASEFAELLTVYRSVQALIDQYTQLHSYESIVAHEHVGFPLVHSITTGKSFPDESDRQEHNKKAREWLINEHNGILRGSGKFPPNHSQCEACVDDDDRTLVLAGAGTGKTATIMTKTRYLVQTGKALPQQILLLAYNRDAAEEMAERIKNDLGTTTPVDVKTFHAFGNNILKSQAGSKRAITTMTEQPEQFNRFIASVIQKNIENDPVYEEAFVSYFLEYGAPVKAESQFENSLDLSIFCRSHDLTTFAQERVKSVGELKIANYLYYWQIPYAYEARYPNTRFSYKPDFFISDKPFLDNENKWQHTVNNLAENAKSAWIEYFGIDKNGDTAHWIDADAYKKQMQSKIELHANNQTDLIVITTADLQAGRLKTVLRSRLNQLGFDIKPMSNAQFVEALFNETSQINPRWKRLIDMIRTFLPLFKDSGLTYDELIERAKQRGIDVDRLQAFIKVFKPVLEGYENYNQREGLLDFSDMIVETSQIINAGHKLPYKYVLVDEFQDISRSRSILLQAILSRSDNAKLFAVGDDWQSIYRFSGSDTNYVSKFAETFGTATMLELDTTYRFPEELNQLTANFVTQNPSQLKKQMHALQKMGQACALLRDVRSCVKVPPDVKPSDVDSYVNKQPVAECYAAAIRSYLDQFSKKVIERQGKNNHVLLLGRNRWENMHCLKAIESLEQLQKNYPQLQLEYKTAHSSKGLEADYVLVIGNDNAIFPSQRQSDQIIEAALPMAESYPFAEERRLFYVAMTRAKRFLILLFDGTQQSIFISELQQNPSQLLKNTARDNTRLKCPHCGMGTIWRQTNGKGETYYRCGDWSLCGKFFAACPECGSPVADTERGKYCLNKQCNYMLLHCPQCGLGTLYSRLNKRRHHLFYGCSNWNSESGIPCSYTTTQVDGEARMHLFSDLIKDKKQEVKQSAR